MPSTQKFLLSLCEEIKLFNSFSFYRESILKLIVKFVPIVNVQGAPDWSEVMPEFNNQGINHLLNNCWITLPVATTNHSLFKIDSCFLNDVEKISYSNQFRVKFLIILPTFNCNKQLLSNKNLPNSFLF